MTEVNPIVKRNKATLTWWAKYYQEANEWFEKEVGDTFSASIYDLMPNLRNWIDPEGCEFEISGTKSITDGPIEVIIDQMSGVLVIDDGHHRFHEAIQAGLTRVEVLVTKKNHVEKILIHKISEDEWFFLKN